MEIKILKISFDYFAPNFNGQFQFSRLTLSLSLSRSFFSSTLESKKVGHLENSDAYDTPLENGEVSQTGTLRDRRTDRRERGAETKLLWHAAVWTPKNKKRRRYFVVVVVLVTLSLSLSLSLSLCLSLTCAT